ncbi:MAG TPA: ABC transporter permease [Chthoniobacterales bacterium]|jgi:ABC-type spermidine/putrescine transport system permease subunit II
MNVLRGFQATCRGLLPVLVLSALLWPLIYSLWISFTPLELLVPPKSDWSLRWYREFFAQSRWTDGLRNSLGIGLGAAAFSVVCGGSVAMAIVRHRFRGRRVLQSAVMLPLFIPALVLGLALLPTMRALGLWGTHVSIAAAHSLWGLPLVFLAVRGALENADIHLEQAARGLGATALQTFRLVTLPIITPGVAVGAVMAFIVSLNELVMALFLCTPDTETLPKVIWPNLRYTLSPLVAAASSVTVLATLLLLAIAAWLGRKLRS